MEKKIAICILAYNRYQHLNRVLNRLFEYDLSGFDLLVFQDGPKDRHDALETNKVTELLESYPSSKFKHKLIRPQNIGLAEAVIESLNICFATYDRAIILEDDILIRDGFLNFMQAALNRYANDDKVAGISGFSYYPKSLGSAYFLPIGCSWGWATWKRSWDGITNDPKGALKTVRKSGRLKEFDFGDYPFSSILQSAADGMSNSWAIQFYAQFFLKSQLFLYPPISLCRNIGFDGSGTHTGEEMASFNSAAQQNKIEQELPEPVLHDPTVSKMKQHMKKLSGSNWKTKFKDRLTSIFK